MVEKNRLYLQFMIPKQNYSSKENSSSVTFLFTDCNSCLTTRIIGREEKIGTGIKGMIGKSTSRYSIPATIATIYNSNNDAYVSLNTFCKKYGNTGPVYPWPVSSLIILCSNRLSSEKEK